MRTIIFLFCFFSSSVFALATTNTNSANKKHFFNKHFFLYQEIGGVYAQALLDRTFEFGSLQDPSSDDKTIGLLGGLSINTWFSLKERIYANLDFALFKMIKYSKKYGTTTRDPGSIFEKKQMILYPSISVRIGNFFPTISFFSVIEETNPNFPDTQIISVKDIWQPNTFLIKLSYNQPIKKKNKYLFFIPSTIKLTAIANPFFKNISFQGETFSSTIENPVLYAIDLGIILNLVYHLHVNINYTKAFMPIKYKNTISFAHNHDIFAIGFNYQFSKYFGSKVVFEKRIFGYGENPSTMMKAFLTWQYTKK